MALSDAVLEIADQLDGVYKGSANADSPEAKLVGVLAGCLRVAVKASHPPPRIPTNDPSPIPPHITAAGLPVILADGHRPEPVFQQILVQQEKRKLHDQQERMEQVRRAEFGAMMRSCEDGPEEGSMIEIDGGMPVGAYTPVAGSVYQLRADGKLYYDEAQTKARSKKSQ